MCKRYCSIFKTPRCVFQNALAYLSSFMRLLRTPHSWINGAWLILGVRLNREKFAQVCQVYPGLPPDDAPIEFGLNISNQSTITLRSTGSWGTFIMPWCFHCIGCWCYRGPLKYSMLFIRRIVHGCCWWGICCSMTHEFQADCVRWQCIDCKSLQRLKMTKTTHFKCCLSSHWFPVQIKFMTK